MKMKKWTIVFLIFNILLIIGIIVYYNNKINKIKISAANISESLKKENESLYSRVQGYKSAYNELQKKYDKVNKKLLENHNTTSTTHIEGNASDTITGTIKEGCKKEISGDKDGFHFHFIINNNSWELNYYLELKLDIFVMETDIPGVYKTKVNTNNSNIEITDIITHFIPNKKPWYKDLHLSFEIGAGEGFLGGILVGYKNYHIGYVYTGNHYITFIYEM